MDIAYINGMILTHMNGENKKERKMRSFFMCYTATAMTNPNFEMFCIRF